MTGGGCRVRLERNFAPRSQTGDLAKQLQLPKQGFYLAAMPASRGQTELKGSEHTPFDASKPLRTTGGGCRAELYEHFELRSQTEIVAKLQKKHDFYLAAMPASWAQIEPKGSECTPLDTFKPLGTTCGGTGPV